MNKSESIKNLSLAVVNFQSHLTPVLKDATNPFFKSKYATLEAVWATVGPLLSKHGLSVLQLGNEGNKIETVLLHTSGEYISGTCEMLPSKNDPQAQGSAISYSRRYWLSAMLGVVAEDDDGERAMSRSQPQKSIHKPNLGVNDGDVVKPQNKDKTARNGGMAIRDIDLADLNKDIKYWREREINDRRPMSGQLLQYIEAAERYVKQNPFISRPIEDDVPMSFDNGEFYK